MIRILFSSGPLSLWLALQRFFSLAPDDLLRSVVYRRLWASLLCSAVGTQVMLLALPLTAAMLLHATPTQMGLLTAVESLPFVLLSLPVGVWLDRVRKLPVYIAGEVVLALVVVSVPLVGWLGSLSMGWLYAVGFVVGCVHTVSGAAAQIVLTQIVPRERLVEAHAKNALANSSAEVVGPGLAGALIRVAGAPAALLINAVLLVISSWVLRGMDVHEPTPTPTPISTPLSVRHHRVSFWRAMRVGLRFVAGQPLLRAMAVMVGGWHLCHYAALTVTILFATRTLGLSEGAVGLCFVALGVGTISASVAGSRIWQRLGPGPTLVLGMALCSMAWLVGAAAPVHAAGVVLFVLMLLMFGVGAVFIFVNFLALRQAVTPAPLLGRMTSTMRWLVLAPAAPGALLGGWLGEHLSLRATLLFAGLAGLAIAAIAWRQAVIRNTRVLPQAQISDEDDAAAIGLPMQDRMA